jgi:PKD repeat protein
MCIATAQEQAVINYDPTTKTIVVESGTAYPQDIAEQIIDSSVFNRVDNTSIICANLSIKANSELIIVNEELKLNCSYDEEYAITNYGNLAISGSTITTVNPKYHSYINSFRGQYTPWSFSLINSTVRNMGSNNNSKAAIYLGSEISSVSNKPASPVIIYNSTIENCEYAFVEEHAYGDLPDGYFNISKTRFSNLSTTRDGNAGLIILVDSAHFVDNIINNVTCSCYILWITGPSDVIIKGNEIYNTSSKVAINSKHSRNINIKDNNIHDNNGTAIYIYKGWVEDYETGDSVINNTIDNQKNEGGYAISVLYSSRTGNLICGNIIKNTVGSVFNVMGTNNSIFEDNIINNCTGAGFVLSDATYRETYLQSENIRFKNNTIQDCAYALELRTNAPNSSFVDEKYINAIPRIHTTNNIPIINGYNSKWSEIKLGANYNIYKYLNVEVIDINGRPIDNATVSINNNINSTYPSINIIGSIKNSTQTGINGHTPLPSDKNNSIAILDYYETNINYQKVTSEMNYTITAEKEGIRATVGGIDPDSTWYRPNADIPTHVVTITLPINQTLDNKPVAFAGPDKSGYNLEEFSFNSSGSTSNTEIISYSWDFDASNGIQSDAIGPIVNHTYETPGVYIVTLTVTNANGNTASDTCTVTVLEELKATKICIFSPNVSLPGKTFTVDVLVDPSTPISGTQLDFVFNSSKTSVNNVTEGDLLKQNGAHTIFSKGTTDNSTGTVKNIYGFILGTSNVSTPGTMATVNLTAGSKTGIAEFSLSNVLISDADSKSVPYTVTNATVLIDTAPVMSSICCPKSVDEKSTLTFKVSAKDADCDRLTLSASGLPEGSSFNRTSGAFNWTPARGQAGVYILTFEVSDGYLTDSENVTVTVNRLNNPPLISSFEPLDGSSFSEGERIKISVNASDAEGQALNYSIMIDGVVCSTGTEYIWETDYSSSGNHTIGVAVSDGIDTIRGQRTIYISECRPRWDVNEDGVVNILDVTSVSQKCGTTVSKPYPRYDVNQDGAVNILDLTLVGNHFGELVK